MTGKTLTDEERDRVAVLLNRLWDDMAALREIIGPPATESPEAETNYEGEGGQTGGGGGGGPVRGGGG